MADGVVISAGTGDGAEIATDDAGVAGHVQIVKLAVSADGDATPITADGSGLEVQVGTALPTGDNNIGNVDIATIAAGDNNIGNVDVASSALPTGASTSAKQDTVIGHLDGVETLLGTIDADTGTLAGAVAGSEMQVDIVSGTVGTELTTADLDTGAGTDTQAVVGISLAEDGGAVQVGSASPLPATITAIAAGDNNIGNVDVASSVLPSGASTSAKQDTIIGHVDGIEGLLTTIDADTGTLAGAVTGTEMQVDVVAALPTGDNNIGNVDIASALPAGTNAIGKLAANSGVDIGDVDVTSISAGTNTIGDVGVKPRTSGGLTIFRSLDLDETEEEVKATAGQLFGWYMFNDGAEDVSVKLYNATTANVSVGSTTPVMTLTIPAGSAANAFSEIGIAFGTAITAAAVTEIADNGTTAPAANQVVVNLFYS